MNLPIEPDMATNLLTGITAETNNFSSPTTTAGTFETAAILLKYGARKVQNEAKNMGKDQISKTGMATTFDKTGRMPFGRQPGQTPAPSTTGFSQQAAFPSQAGYKSKSLPGQQQPSQSPPPPQQFGKPHQQQQHPSIREAGKPPETPPDWLKPKIYKGSTLL
ncbi:hypothetical protein A3I51_00705 [Candidatus Gottesmanbacteria bacterium RIFCSPLOWO2_02_FULL_38_8]|nr:MAG: hypothetical protein A3I51_00705 [Candidatus Gottesmanbacteria bacterium RIFCSPLOWO2_02_FULL_38_8]